MSEAWPWLALLGLGTFHGIKPRDGLALCGSAWAAGTAVFGRLERLPPIAFGHALSVGLVVALVAVIHASIPYHALRWIAAAVLIGFGAYRLVRARHPRWVGMRVGFRDRGRS